MSENGEGTGPPLDGWLSDLTGADGEFMLRFSSADDLGVGLHQLVVIAEQHVEEHDRLPAADIANRSLSARTAPPDIREQVIRQLSGALERYEQVIQSHLDQLDPDPDPRQTPDPFQLIAAQLASPVAQGIAEVMAAAPEMTSDNQALLSYLMQYYQAAQRRPLLPLMRRALLITAVASTETALIGTLHRIQYDHGGSERWGPLVNNPELEKAVRDLTHGNIEDWAPHLATELEVTLPDATFDWPAVTEIWARRNVLVHAGGIADHKYADRVPGATLGTRLEVDGQYLRDAIDLLCGFILGVIVLAWATRPERRRFAGQLATIYANHADSENRWPLAANLHALAARLDDDHRESAASQVNSWLARTQWRGPESVRDEVTAWDLNNLPAVFTLAKLILLGQTEPAMTLLTQLLDQGELTTDQLQNWPLFDPLRSKPEFQPLLNRE